MSKPMVLSRKPLETNEWEFNFSLGTAVASGTTHTVWMGPCADAPWGHMCIDTYSADGTKTHSHYRPGDLGFTTNTKP